MIARNIDSEVLPTLSPIFTGSIKNVKFGLQGPLLSKRSIGIARIFSGSALSLTKNLMTFF